MKGSPFEILILQLLKIRDCLKRGSNSDPEKKLKRSVPCNK